MPATGCRPVDLPEPPTVVLTGAGLSTASGIPDFRSAGGIWERFDPDAFTIQRFRDDPAGFWRRRARLIAEMGTLDARPNPAHACLAQAAQEERVACIVTQNVDGLHQAAGTPPHRLIEVHGNGNVSRCVDCFQTEPVQETLARLEAPVPRQEVQPSRQGAMREATAAAAPPHPGRGAPRCQACGGHVKPDVVLFGEPVTRLPEAAQAVADARSLVVVGSSLQVHPVAGLVDLALGQRCGLWILNRDATPYDDDATVVRGDILESVPRLFGSL